MWIRVEGGVRQCGYGTLYVLGLFKGSFGLLNRYLAYFYPKQKIFFFKYLS